MLKTLAHNIKGFVKESIITPLSMILEVIMEMLIPLLMASLIDEGVNTGDMNAILYYGGLMGICAIIGLFAGVSGAVFGAKASAGFAKNLRMSCAVHTFHSTYRDLLADARAGNRNR